MKPVFLSSVFADPEGQRVHLRDRMIDITGGKDEPARSARPVWMAEDFPALRPESPWPAIEKASLCLDGVREAECFVAVITTRHGTPVTVDQAGTVPSSFFEAELFEAALLEKPAFVFLLEGYEPDPKLGSLLQLLKPHFPNMDLRPMSEGQILRRIEQLAKQFGRPRWLRPNLARPQVSSVVRALFGKRHHAYDARSEAPPLRFLNGMFDPALPVPEPTLVEAVIAQAETDSRQQVRLMLLWFAIRALMGAPYTDPAFAHLLPLWSRALGRWTSAGAWYGIHGHISLGCLAALGSAADVGIRLGKRPEAWRNIPHGPLASEYYSIARLAGLPGTILPLALVHIEAALASGAGDRAGQLAIRASIHREMGNLPAAIADYQDVVRLRQVDEGKTNGEAESELGYALFLAGEHKPGIELMERGLADLRQAPPSGFQIRAMRKLAAGYARRFHPLRALDLAADAYELATQLGAYDQIRDLERLAMRIDRMLGRRN